ncbi:2'-5' RNA ligase family protein [Nocardia sp. NPDC003482]
MSAMASPADRGDDPPAEALGYYWFLTFEHALELHAAVKECQRHIDPDLFDLTPTSGLHLTVDRIARVGKTTRECLDSIAAAAVRTCQGQPPLTLRLAHVTSLRGAIGFIVTPADAVRALRDRLRAATLTISPDAPVKMSASTPHITIAYPASENASAVAASTAGEIDAVIAPVDVVVTEAVLVRLERGRSGYTWEVQARIPLRAR